jgi:hypothetical protein
VNRTPSDVGPIPDSTRNRIHLERIRLWYPERDLEVFWRFSVHLEIAIKVHPNRDSRGEELLGCDSCLHLELTLVLDY